MRAIEWTSEREFTVGGVHFLCSLHDFSLQTDERRFVILKTKSVLDHYLAYFADDEPRRILEFGIFQGGSPALFATLFDVEKFVGIDVCAPVTAFDSFCSRHPIGKRIRSHYGVSQTDAKQVAEIIRNEFAAPPDLIIDDASHLYRETRRTFEIAFPLLRPGGTYVVEDWGWAHWTHGEFLPGKTAMSMLIMELMMLCASRSDLISEVRVFPAFAFIRKAPCAPLLTDLRLDSVYAKRGMELIGADGTNLSKLGRLFGNQLRIKTTNELRRWRRRLRAKQG